MKLAWTGIVVLLTGISSALAAGPDLERAEALLRDKKAQEAYDLLEPFEFDEAGNLKYDYLLGLAALESGKPEKASLVFERVLALEPRYLGVRLDLARSYYLIGDLARATQEFQTVLAQTPPPDLQAIAERYLQAIEQAKMPRRWSALAYLEVGGGRDTNVNSATSVNPINLPAANNQPFFLDPSSVGRPDNYISGTLGGEVGYLLSPRWSVYAGADARYRSYANIDTANYGTVDGRAGVALNLGTHLLRLGVTSGGYWLDDKSYRQSLGGTGEWRYQASARDQLSLSGQYIAYRYVPDALTSADFNQGLGSLGWLHVFPSGKALISLNLNAGYDHDVGGRQDGDAMLGGGRAFTQIAVTERIGLFATAGAQRNAYQKINDTFLVERADSLYDATIGLNWQFARLWSLRPQVQLIRNVSNIDLYDFERADLSLNLRRDFRW